MERMNYAHNVHEAFSMFHNKQGVRLAKVSPDMFDLVMHYLYEDD